MRSADAGHEARAGLAAACSLKPGDYRGAGRGTRKSRGHRVCSADASHRSAGPGRSPDLPRRAPFGGGSGRRCIGGELSYIIVGSTGG
jgi:hypothetical protein